MPALPWLRCTRRLRPTRGWPERRWWPGDIGPTGALLEPLGTLTFDEAFDIFSEQARAAEAAGCDLIVVETMADLLEAKAAVLAAVESTTLPVFATMTFGEDGRTFLGTTPAIAATTLSALGASAVGLNCSLGPTELAPLVGELAPHDRALVMAQPNAGLPRIQDGETVFDVGPNEFAQAMEAIMDAGATVVGGCCGTTPDHIAALRALIDVRPLPAVASVSVPAHTSVASSATAVSAGSASSPCCLGGAKRAEGPLGVQRPQPALLSCLRGDLGAADGVAARGRGAHRRHRRAHQPDGEEEAESGSASG